MAMTIIDDQTKQPLTLLPITRLHHNVGKVFDELAKTGGYAVVRDSEVVGRILPPVGVKKTETIEEMLAKVDKLAGGLKLKRDRSPEEMNKDYDKIYDKVLPR